MENNAAMTLSYSKTFLTGNMAGITVRVSYACPLDAAILRVATLESMGVRTEYGSSSTFQISDILVAPAAQAVA